MLPLEHVRLSWDVSLTNRETRADVLSIADNSCAGTAFADTQRDVPSRRRTQNNSARAPRGLAGGYPFQDPVVPPPSLTSVK